MTTTRWLAGAGFAFLLLPGANAGAQASQQSAALSPDAVIEQALAALDPERQLVLVIGNDREWAGDPTRLDGEWLALTCSAQCALQPARLRIDPPAEGRYLPALHFEPATGADVQAWLHVDPLRAWMVAGPVARYAFGARIDTPGSFELAIETPAAGGALLLPLIQPAAPDVPASLYLQLREDGRRQLLPGWLASCAADGVPTSDFLHWAGDLDRDGRADYVVRFGDNVGDVHLYLSSEADPAALVGLAGRGGPGPQVQRCDFGEE